MVLIINIISCTRCVLFIFCSHCIPCTSSTYSCQSVTRWIGILSGWWRWWWEWTIHSFMNPEMEFAIAPANARLGSKYKFNCYHYFLNKHRRRSVYPSVDVVVVVGVEGEHTICWMFAEFQQLTHSDDKYLLFMIFHADTTNIMQKCKLSGK